jgi:hypothetical protein
MHSRFFPNLSDTKNESKVMCTINMHFGYNEKKEKKLEEDYF